MPRTVYEWPRVEAHGEEAPAVPKGWAYIGATVQSFDETVWVYSPVWNRDGAAWSLLNAEIDKVDYVLRVKAWDRVLLDITDENNAEFGQFHLVITNITTGGEVFLDTYLPDDTDTYLVTGMEGETTYEFDLRVQLTDLSWTGPSVQQVTTPKNPIPKPCVLSYTAATNYDIDLAWTSPPDSTAVKYRVYAGVGWGGSWAVGNNGIDTQPTVNKWWKCISLGPDTPYYYQVAGINSSGVEGPRSNRVQVHTGHDAAFAEGWREDLINPAVWGSYRGDYKWQNLQNGYRRDNYRIQQGYWQADPRTTGTTYDINRPQEEAGRYTGCMVYNIDEFRARIGVAVADSLDVHRCEILRLYRFRWHGAHWPPESPIPNWMGWHLTYADVRNPGASPHIYGFHRNDRNDADALAGQDSLNSGYYHTNLRLPRSFGKALATGWWNGSRINGVCMFRDGHENSGSGAAGYGAWAAHMTYDDYYHTLIPRSDQYSDWRIRISGTYRYQTRAYQGPFLW